MPIQYIPGESVTEDDDTNTVFAFAVVVIVPKLPMVGPTGLPPTER